MDGFLLQDLISLKGTRIAGGAIIQTSSSWLDVGNYEDLVAYVDVREITSGGGTTITYETAMVKQDASFVPIVPAITLAVGLNTTVLAAPFANIPVARYFRWKLNGSTSIYEATFRIWLAGYAHG